MFRNISESFEWFSLHFRSLFDWFAVADPEEGPGGPAPEISGDRASPYLRICMTPPPLSEGLDPPL